MKESGFYNKNTTGPQAYKNVLELTRNLEDKLVQIKLDFAQKSEQIEETKYELAKLNKSIELKNQEIMKLNNEFEKLNESTNKRTEIFRPPRQSLGSPRAPINLLRK